MAINYLKFEFEIWTRNIANTMFELTNEYKL